MCCRRDHFVRRHPQSFSGDGQDGLDCTLSGGVCPHSALPYNAADCHGLLEVSTKFNMSNLTPKGTSSCKKTKKRVLLMQKWSVLIRLMSLVMNDWAAPLSLWPHLCILSLSDTATCFRIFQFRLNVSALRFVCIGLLSRLLCTLHIRPSTHPSEEPRGLQHQRGSQLCLHLPGSFPATLLDRQ